MWPPARWPKGCRRSTRCAGIPSHQFNPFLALKRPDCGEMHGEVYGFSLVYSGNFLAQADVDPYHVTRVTMGIHPQNFSWTLRPRRDLCHARSRDGLQRPGAQRHVTGFPHPVPQPAGPGRLARRGPALSWSTTGKPPILTSTRRSCWRWRPKPRRWALSFLCWTTAGSGTAAATRPAWATGKWTPPSCQAG